MNKAIHWSEVDAAERSRVILKTCKQGTSASDVVLILAESGIRGATRNAIISHVHRKMRGVFQFSRDNGGHGFHRKRRAKPVPQGKVNSVRVREQFHRKPRSVTALAEPVPAPDPATAVSMMDAGFNHCRYPITSEFPGPDEPYFCGGQTKPGSSWCAHHGEVCFTEYQPRRKAA